VSRERPDTEATRGGYATPVNVLCMKWGAAFGPEWVNRLRAGVARHLTIPHRFICFTDDPIGLDPDVEHFPLVDIEVPEGEGDLRWRKLAVFRQRLHDLEGPALFLDLDVVIVGSLDPFFERPGGFHIIRDDDLAGPKPLRWLHPARARRMARVGNSSVFRFEIGEHADILETFLADPEGHIENQPHRREQEYLTEELHRQGLLRYWPKEWCVSYKTHCVPHFPLAYSRDPAPPPDARVLVFAGRLKIPDAIAGRGGRWYRPIRPAPWLEAEWKGRGTKLLQR
jgi:hypothetical protein